MQDNCGWNIISSEESFVLRKSQGKENDGQNGPDADHNQSKEGRQK